MRPPPMLYCPQPTMFQGINSQQKSYPELIQRFYLKSKSENSKWIFNFLDSEIVFKRALLEAFWWTAVTHVVTHRPRLTLWRAANCSVWNRVKIDETVLIVDPASAFDTSPYSNSGNFANCSYRMYCPNGSLISHPSLQ